MQSIAKRSQTHNEERMLWRMLFMQPSSIFNAPQVGHAAIQWIEFTLLGHMLIEFVAPDRLLVIRGRQEVFLEVWEKLIDKLWEPLSTEGVRGVNGGWEQDASQ